MRHSPPTPPHPPAPYRSRVALGLPWVVVGREGAGSGLKESRFLPGDGGSRAGGFGEEKAVPAPPGRAPERLSQELGE